MVALVEQASTEVEVIDGHRTQRRIDPGVWPKLDLDIVATKSERIRVKTPAGQTYKVVVRFLVRDGYVVAYGIADDPGRNEVDPDAPGTFPQCCEVVAETLALGLI